MLSVNYKVLIHHKLNLRQLLKQLSSFSAMYTHSLYYKGGYHLTHFIIFVNNSESASGSVLPVAFVLR